MAAAKRELPPFMTYIILAIIAAVAWFVTGFFPTKESLDPVMFSKERLESRPETFLYSQFAHGGLLHLMFNSMALLSFGAFVESQLGWFRFTLLYLFSGSVGNLAHIMFQPEIPIVGASGAIFGLLGVLLILSPTLKVALLNIIPVPILIVGAAYAALLPLLVLTMDVVPIAHEAHVGGMLAGAAFAVLMKPRFAILVLPAAFVIFFAASFLVDGFVKFGADLEIWKIVLALAVIGGAYAYLQWVEKKQLGPRAMDADPGDDY